VASASAGARFEVLREIFEVARRQRACLEQDEIEDLPALMDRRDVLVQRLQALLDEPDVAPPNVIVFPSLSVADEAAQDRIALDALIRGILEHDLQSERLVRAKMDGVQSQIAPIHAGRRAAAGYRVTQPGAAYIDRAS
jgi:hypothetical protein